MAIAVEPAVVHRNENEVTVGARIRGIRLAVHDLSDWPNEEDRDSCWRLDPSRVAEARHPVQEWFANEALPAHH